MVDMVDMATIVMVKQDIDHLVLILKQDLDTDHMVGAARDNFKIRKIPILMVAAAAALLLLLIVEVKMAQFQGKVYLLALDLAVNREELELEDMETVVQFICL